MRLRMTLAALLIACACPALAQGDVYCQAANGAYDAAATDTFMQLAGRNDAQAAQFLVGTWYSESTSPRGQQARAQLIYTADGQFAYQQRICDQLGYCSDFQGMGYWAAMMLNSGEIQLMTILSDQSRNHECTGADLQILDPSHYQSAGVVAERVQ